MIYWASSDDQLSNGVYRIGWGKTTLFHFFPHGFWRALGLAQQLAKGMAWHFFFMWFFAINGVLYVLYTIVSGEWRFLVPDRHSLAGAFQVLLHDLHLRKTLPPFVRYNPAQRIAYSLIILMGGASLVTGAVVYRPVQLGWLTAVLGGYQWARAEHFWLTIGYVLFFAVHVAQVARAGWRNFRGMVAGADVEAGEPVSGGGA